MNDAKALADFLRVLDSESEYLGHEPGERNLEITHVEEEIHKLPSEKSMIFVASMGDEIVGFLRAKAQTMKRRQHSVTIGVGVLQAMQGKGIAKDLLSALEIWSKQKEFIRLELTVAVQNVGAIELYKKLGYEVEGIIRASLRVGDEILDEYLMAKVLR